MFRIDSHKGNNAYPDITNRERANERSVTFIAVKPHNLNLRYDSENH